jgi:hypothetical protein
LISQIEVGWIVSSSLPMPNELPDNDQLTSDDDAVFAKGILHSMRALGERQQRT